MKKLMVIIGLLIAVVCIASDTHIVIERGWIRGKDCNDGSGFWASKGCDISFEREVPKGEVVAWWFPDAPVWIGEHVEVTIEVFDYDGRYAKIVKTKRLD